MATETRNLRKRRWKSSPQKSARVGLDFGLETPTPKKRRLLSSELSKKPDPDSFNIGSFYGKREKTHFPHSPSRRKAVDKVLRKISDEMKDSENTSLVVKGRRNSLPARVQEKKSPRPTYEFHNSGSESTESDEQVRNILKPWNTQQKKSAKKVPLKMDTKKTPKNSRSLVKREVKSTGKTKSKPSPMVDDPNKTPIISSERKFFKTRTPASADRVFGAIIIKKGFNVTFVARKLKLGKTANEDSGKKKTNTPTTKAVGRVKAKTVRSIDPEGVFAVAEKENSRLNKGYRKLSANTSHCETQKETADALKLNRTNSSVEHLSENPYADNSKSEDTINDSTEVLKEKTDGTFEVASEFVEEEATGSEDLFAGSSVTGCSTPVSMTTTPSASTSPSSPASSDGHISHASGPEEEPRTKQKLFPIFTRGPSNLSTPSSTSSRLSRFRAARSSPLLNCTKTKDTNKEQMGIDAGQKWFGLTQCDACGMMYEVADPTDEMVHNKFHQGLLNALKFPGWKKENVVRVFRDTGSRIVKVTADDPNYATTKVEQINGIMGKELGYTELLSFKSSYQAFLYISDDKKIEGCCLCEPISKAYPVLTNTQENKSSGEGDLSQRPWYCSDTPVPASMGVSRIWVYKQARKQGVATKLLDCVREWSVYGSVVPKHMLAFSDPTPDGKVLATQYTGTPNFLVYKFT